MLHFKRVLWALRKINLPIGDKDIVLDIGSGNNPHPRSDVLIDRLSGNEHRSGTPMLIDRSAVIGDALKLPFKDKAFDFVIASHILEHISDPDTFFKEIQRVGKAGYIETPSFLYERLNPSVAHCLEVHTNGEELVINKKGSPVVDNFMKDSGYLTTPNAWSELAHNDPGLFHVRFYWKDNIRYKILNPEVSCDWANSIYDQSTSNDVVYSNHNERKGWRKFGIKLMQRYFNHGRKKRLSEEKFYSLLACPECHGSLNKVEANLVCSKCNNSYPTVPFVNFENK